MSSYFQMGLGFRRKDFKYPAGSDSFRGALVQDTIAQKLEKAKNGIEPFDVAGTFFSESYCSSSSARLSNYRKHWNFYEGDHWDSPYDLNGKEKPVFNFCRPIADKAVDWTVATDFSCVSVSGNEAVAEAINKCWKENNKESILTHAAYNAIVSGDAFLFLALKTLDDEGKPLQPKDYQIVLESLNPAYCFPIWENTQGAKKMRAFIIQFPTTYNGKDTLFTMYITNTEYVIYYDTQQVRKSPNSFGQIPVVHIPNTPVPSSPFGESDLEPIENLNKEYNECALSMRRVIRYQGEPITVVYGTRFSTMERGADKIWSNLPDNAKVEILELKSTSLDSTAKYMETLFNSICMLSHTPKIVLDSESIRVSNTSGLAMQLLFQPLLEKTRRRSVPFSAAMREFNQLILKAKEMRGDDMLKLADNAQEYRNLDVVHKSPLPRDEQAELDAAIKKVQSGFWSKAHATRVVSGVTDFERLALEITADTQRDIALAYEKGKASTGVPPNFAAAFLGSHSLSEDLVPAAQQAAKASTEAVPDEDDEDDEEENE